MKSGAERLQAPRSLALSRAFKADADHKSDPEGSRVCLDFFVGVPWTR